MRGMQFVYLELACYGLSNEEIARRYGVKPQTVAEKVLEASRIVGRLGFWKFHVPSSDAIPLLSRKLLDAMYRHEILTGKVAA